MSQPITTLHAEQLPSALDRFDDLLNAFGGRQVALFLDYDGTLSPIVPDRHAAQLSEEMRDKIRRLATHRRVVIVSGRDRADVAEKVALPELLYVGSHGFDIKGPELEEQHEGGRRVLPELDAAEASLRRKLAAVPGAEVERKRYAIAVHYRQVAADRKEEVKQAARDEAREHPVLKPAGGKSIVELKPNFDWHKGKAVRFLLDVLALDPAQTVPLFVGDDLTDEDAFRALREVGIGVLVGNHGETTAAHYALRDVPEVSRFLDRVLQEIEAQPAR
ncbi:MAG: trehalose-phosphatase [Catalinimonas sp.]